MSTPAERPSSGYAGLIAEAVAGDPIALQAILHLHRARLVSYVQRRLPQDLRGAYDVDDVVQETFVEAYRHVRSFVPDGGEDPMVRWLLTIAHDHMASLLRRARTLKRGGAWVRRAVNTEGDTGTVALLLEQLAVYHRTPSTSAAAHELAIALEQSIGRLPADTARAVTLRHVERLPVREAAERMSRTEGAVHQLCHRGLSKMREDLRSRSFFV